MSSAVPGFTTCDNCGASLHGPFCAFCGQEAQPLAPRLRDVARDMTHDLLDVDGRTPRSVRALFLQPGRLTREQFEGRRVRWLSPTKLYLIFSVAYFAMAAIAGSSVRLQMQTQNDLETRTELRRLGYENEEEMRQAIGRAQATWMPRVMFVLVPVFAGLVQVARRRSGHTYPQHLQFALHLHAAAFGLGALLTALSLTLSPQVHQVLRPLVLLYIVVYGVMAFRVAYGGTRGQAMLHAIVVFAIYGLLLLLATLAIILPYIFGGAR